MDMIAFVFIWVLISGSTVVSSIRSGNAPFFLHATVTRCDNALSYWLSTIFWLCAFGFTLYSLALLCIHAYQGERPFDTRGLWPVTPKQWVLAATDAFLLIAFAYFFWSRVQTDRLLKEIEAAEKDGA